MKNKNYGASSYSFSETTSRHFSSGKYYLILYIAKGTCHFKVDDEWKYCSTEDMVVIKPGNRTSMTFRGGRHQLEILELRVLPEYLETLSDESTNLLEAFQFVPYEIRVLRVGSNLSMLIKNITLNRVAISFDDKELGVIQTKKPIVQSAIKCINPTERRIGRCILIAQHRTHPVTVAKLLTLRPAFGDKPTLRRFFLSHKPLRFVLRS